MTTEAAQPDVDAAFDVMSPSAKRWWTGSHRVRLPAATLADLLPHLTFYGITRLADLTGLDRVGVPVWSAIRPGTR